MANEMADRSKSDKKIVDSSSFVYSPAETIQMIEDSPEQLLLLDLDLTLVLGPTTEAFLDSARPSSYAYAILAVTEKISPWRFLPGRQRNRDWIRVLVLFLLMPWSYFRWRAAATSWTQENVNQPLVNAARNHKGRVVVITRGFAAIVNPVVKALHLNGEEKVLTIACRASRWRGLRQFSKTEHVARSSALINIEDSMVVSDSIQDYDLFAACKTPVLAEWQGAYWIEPHQNAYIPLRYVQLTKTPFKGFVQVGWLKDDLYIALLALSPATWFFPVHAIGIILLSFALWTIYETGYYENDMVGSVREVDPVLPENFSEVRGSVPRYAPWGWAFAMTVLGAFLIALGSSWSLRAVFLICLGWMAVLASIRLVFALFNRLPKVHRVIPHLLLQIGKYFGYLAVTAVSAIGVALLLSQVAYRWLPYVRYRWSKKSRKFADGPLHRTRFLLFAVLGAFSLFFVDYSIHQLVVFGMAAVLLGRRVVKEFSFSRGLSRQVPHARSVA